MLRISWTEHVTNEEVFNRANTKPTLLDGLLKRRLAFHGHLARKDGITLDLMIGRLHGTGPRGRRITTWLKDLATQANISYKEAITIPSSSFCSFHQESYVRQIVPSQCLTQPMAMPLAVARSWGEQAVSIMGQTSRCCMVCLMPQSHVSCSLENPHFNIIYS